MLRNRTFRLILSLVIAIALWLYVVGNVNPEITATVHSIPVEMTNEDVLEDMDLEASLTEPETVDIVIRGSRSDVNEAKKSEIRALVDVSNCDYGENEEKIEIRFPEEINGVSVDSITPDTAGFNVK